MRASAVPVASSRIFTLPAYSTHVADLPPTPTCASVVPVMPLPASSLPSSCLPKFTRATLYVPVVYPSVSLFSSQPYNAGPTFTHAAQAYVSVSLPYHATLLCRPGAYTSSPYVEGPHIPPSHQRVSENLLATVATTIEKISANQGLPPLQVLKCDGSPERYPLFRQRFHQMVESKALHE